MEKKASKVWLEHILYSSRDVGHSRNASFNVWASDVWHTLCTGWFGKSTWQNRLRYESKKTVSCLDTHTVWVEMHKFGDFVSVLLLPFDALPVFDRSWFACLSEMAENTSKSLLCANCQRFFFWLFFEARDKVYLHSSQMFCILQ